MMITKTQIEFKGVSKKYIFEPVVVDERKELDDNNDYYVDQEIEGGTTGKYKSETNRSKDKSKNFFDGIFGSNCR